MDIDFDNEHDWFRERLKESGDEKRATGEKKYLKSPWKFYGVSVPQRYKIIKDWFKKHQPLQPDEAGKLAESLWDSEWHEEKSLAIEILQLVSGRLTVKQMPLVEKMINEVTGWDHLDEIAIHVVGAMIDNDMAALKYLPKWTKSKNFWVRRAAILSQILQFRRRDGDKKLFCELVVPMFDEGVRWSKEERFFIRKAIGWTLREIANVEPEVAFNFVKRYKHKMSGLTFREASRKLPVKFRDLLG
ncbi:DNA alkylation repair protein [Candidatus Collierbacteria bacterium]|nr:DNA alkylation repair protein [Candidatus Collierbacteria bacterium]